MMHVPVQSRRFKRQSALSSRASQGFGLVELLISATVSLVLVAVAAAMYAGSRSTYRAVDEQSQMNEDARMVLGTLGRDLRQSGYTDAIVLSDPYLRAPMTLAVTGCDKSLNAPASDLVTCATTQPTNTAGDSLTIQYDVGTVQTVGASTYDPVDVTSGRNTNCLGGRPPYYNYPKGGSQTLATAGATGSTALVKNAYYIVRTTQVNNGVTETVGTLTCSTLKSDGTVDTPQALFQGVEDLQVSFGLEASTDDNSDRYFVTATTLNATPANWESVTAVRVCILMRSQSKNIASSTTVQTYTDCTGATQTPDSNRWLYHAYTQVFGIRNHTEGAISF